MNWEIVKRQRERERNITVERKEKRDGKERRGKVKRDDIWWTARKKQLKKRRKEEKDEREEEGGRGGERTSDESYIVKMKRGKL